MGLFFVTKGRYQRVLDDRNYYRDRSDKLTDSRDNLIVENRRLKEAVKASREAFDKVVPVTVVHTWTSA